MVPGLLAPPDPETRIDEVGLSLPGFSAAPGLGVRCVLGDADTLADCCSSRRKFASEDDGGVLPTTTVLLGELARSACERLARDV